MCRLFGFRSSVPSAVHRSLVLETNALRRQSLEHPDGWGLAWFEGGRPRVDRGVDGAFADEKFASLSTLISSETVIGHVRKASVGALTPENTHPFTWGPWVFAHNGTIDRFDEVRSRLDAAIARSRLGSIRGETDSERLFALFLTRLETRADLFESEIPLAQVLRSLAEVLQITLEACEGTGEQPSLNLIVTNGRVMGATRQGRSLYVSTHKVRCPERDSCRHFRPCCEEPVPPDVPVNHFLVASERTGEVDRWQELPNASLVGIDEAMRVRREKLGSDIADDAPPPLLRVIA